MNPPAPSTRRPVLVDEVDRVLEFNEPREGGMGYGDFDFDFLLEHFDLTVTQVPLFAQVAPVAPNAWLRDALHKGRPVAFLSEKSRSEFIVAPILLTCQELAGEAYYLYSGVRLDVDAAQGLNGECDFILARTPPTPTLRAPLLVVVEAKKNDIEEGLPQCAAQMVAARLFNETHHSPVAQLHGCVTTGEAWQFLRLTGKELLIDADRYYISDVAKILGVLLAIAKGAT